MPKPIVLPSYGSRPTVLPVAEYLPDQPDFVAQGSSNILNVYPRTAQSYGPVNAPKVIDYGALNGRCQGGIGYLVPGPQVYLFAGTSTDLYYITAGQNAWQSASKSAGAYAVGVDQQWQFLYFNGEVIAVNIVNPPQYFAPGSVTTFADLPGSPPKARYIAAIKNAFVMLGNISDSVLGDKPQRIQWCAAGDAHNWPTPGGATAAEFQAGAADLLGPQGEVMGIAADLINADGAVIQQWGVRRLMYVGPPDIFTLLPVENAMGTAAPASIVSFGGVAYYYARDGFAAYDGSAQVARIGRQKIDNTFAALCDFNFVDRVIGVPDPINRLVWWCFPGPQHDNAGNPNYALIYSIDLERWSLVQMASCEVLVRMLGVGYSLDQLQSVLGYTNIDTLPAPLDSLLWVGGTSQVGIFNTSHQLSFMTGDPLAATVETNEIQPFSGRRSLITRQGARPYIDGASPTPTVSLGHRERQADAVSYTSDIALNSLGVCPIRTSGRYMRATLKVPAGAGTWKHISGVELDAIPAGSR